MFRRKTDFQRGMERRRRFEERRRKRQEKERTQEQEEPLSAPGDQQINEKTPQINLIGCAAAVLFTGLSAAAFIVWSSLLPNAPVESAPPDGNPTDANIPNGAGNSASTQKGSLRIILPSAEADGGAWTSELRQESIPKGNANRLKLVAEVWASAMTGAGGLDPSTELLGAYMDAQNHAYLDFTGGFADSLNRGITRELEIVSSLAKTIRANLPATQRAVLLVEGNELDLNAAQLRLSGPIDLEFYASLDDAL